MKLLAYNGNEGHAEAAWSYCQPQLTLPMIRCIFFHPHYEFLLSSSRRLHIFVLHLFRRGASQKASPLCFPVLLSPFAFRHQTGNFVYSTIGTQYCSMFIDMVLLHQITAHFSVPTILTGLWGPLLGWPRISIFIKFTSRSLPLCRLCIGSRFILRGWCSYRWSRGWFPRGWLLWDRFFWEMMLKIGILSERVLWVGSLWLLKFLHAGIGIHGECKRNSSSRKVTLKKILCRASQHVKGPGCTSRIAEGSWSCRNQKSQFNVQYWGLDWCGLWSRYERRGMGEEQE